MRLHTTDLLTEGFKDALSAVGPAGGDILWAVPRKERNGDHATNLAMRFAQAARRPPRRVAGAIVAHFPRIAAEERRVFHSDDKAHRVITDDRGQTLARLGLSAAVDQGVRNELGLLGVSAPMACEEG